MTGRAVSGIFVIEPSLLEKMLDTIYDTTYNTFRKPNRNPITIPKDTPIKRTYVEMVKEVVESEEGINDEND